MKFVKQYKLKKATTGSGLKRIKEYVTEFGKPMKIYTDNRTQFMSK